MTRRKQFLLGMKRSIPVMFGFIPVSIAFAVLAGEAGLSTLETILMSVFVFAGASQIMAIELISLGSAFFEIVFATFIVNLRHFIMGTCIMRKMKKTKLHEKLICSFGVTDEAFALTATMPERELSPWFMYGVIVVTYGSWVGGTVIGAFASNILPAQLSNALGIALYALFISILVPSIRKNLRLILLVILTAIVNSILVWIGLKSSWSIIISCIVCALFGVWFIKDPSEPASIDGDDADTFPKASEEVSQ
ncbi:MAG: AzlC family ABC transporter permease [Clostridia bacterium]|nr:AzlC family ABC transporter permease [Clostridia bacterium]